MPGSFLRCPGSNVATISCSHSMVFSPGIAGKCWKYCVARRCTIWNGYLRGQRQTLDNTDIHYILCVVRSLSACVYIHASGSVVIVFLVSTPRAVCVCARMFKYIYTLCRPYCLTINLVTWWMIMGIQPQHAINSCGYIVEIDGSGGILEGKKTIVVVSCSIFESALTWDHLQLHGVCKVWKSPIRTANGMDQKFLSEKHKIPNNAPK